MYHKEFETYYLAGISLMVCDNASGAPALVILPFDSDSERQLSDNDPTLWFN